MKLTLKELENDDRKSGYNHVNMANDGRAKPYRGYGSIVPPKPGQQYAVDWTGPYRATNTEAAQDYADHINGGAAVRVHTGRSGRPDFLKLDGVLHVDLPGAPSSTPAKPASTRRTSPERDFMLRMEPRMRALMRNGDMAEAKAGVGRQAVATAIGQLLLRRHEMGKGRMFMVLPSEPSATVQNCLKKHKITLVTEESVVSTA